MSAKNSYKNSNFGQHLTEYELEMLMKHNKIVNFKKGDILFHQGKILDGIFVILEGSVVLQAKILGGGVATLETLDGGSFLGEISFIEKTPSAASGIAIDQVECLFISGVYIELLAAYFPETKYKIYNLISNQVCDRLKKMHHKIVAAIADSQMAAHSFFGEIMRSLGTPEIISFTQAQITEHQLDVMPSLSVFSQEEKKELFSHGVMLKAEKNTMLIHKGEHTPSCFLVLHGAVQSSIEHENKIAKLSVIGPAILFASVSCVDKNSEFTVTFAARESAILLKFSEKDLNYFQSEHPQLWYKLYDLICRSLVALEKSMDKLDIRLNIEIYNR